jgi:guanylate cyclase
MSLRGVAERLLGIADEPSDDDDLRLRKRVGVAASYLTIVAPLGVPFFSGGNPIGFAMAIGLPVINVVNLVVLARTHRFVRYTTVLLASGLLFTLGADVLIGGLAAGAGVVWAFLGPAYALLALGPRAATIWFGAYVSLVLLAVAIDPWVTTAIALPPYAVRLVSFAQNLIAPLGITFLLLRYTDIRRRQAEARSDELLTNAIPRSIATRLRHGEERIAETYPETTVVFADLVGFTPWAQRTGAPEVVGFLDDLFRRFDALAARHGVEKIKTIGDAYMAVAGAPEARQDHAEAGIQVAIGMLDALVEVQRGHDALLQLRVGLASGPVVGGIIGQRRILFDLWGETVNIASRMESSGLPGRIQVAASTHGLLRGEHEFEQRDDVEVKGLGPMTTYLLITGRRTSE